MTSTGIKSRIGFTLIEMVLVIIILGVVSTGIARFVGIGAEIYSDVVTRDQLLSEGRFVVERLNRELRAALPNSVRLKGNSDVHCMEFVPIQDSTFYFDIPVAPESTSSAVAAIELTNSTVDNSNFVVVYPTQESHVYGNNPRRESISSVVTSASTGVAAITLDNSVRFAEDSPASRMYIVDGPVSYCATKGPAGRITRHSGYGSGSNEGYYITQSTDMTSSTTGIGAGVLMAQGLVNDLSNNPQSTGGNSDNPFRIYEGSLSRNAFVHVMLRFEVSDEILVFNNEVHFANAP